MGRTGKVAVPGLVALVLSWAAAPSSGHDGKQSAGTSTQPPSTLKWREGPPSLPTGAKLAVLEGDPAKDGPFVMRLKLPDGYRLPPHTHPKPERVTVLSGTFYLGTGDQFDPAKAREMPAGSYGTWPAGMKHFVWVK